MVLGKLTSTCERIKLEPYPIHRYQLKINEKLVTAETVKFLGENMWKKLHDIGLGNDIFILPKAQGTKTK